MENYDIVKNDFNEIAQLDDPKWNHNNCYYNQIMKLIPDNAETCLEIGCGKGELSFFSSIVTRHNKAAQKSHNKIALKSE